MHSLCIGHDFGLTYVLPWVENMMESMVTFLKNVSGLQLHKRGPAFCKIESHKLKGESLCAAYNRRCAAVIAVIDSRLTTYGCSC